MRAGAHAIYMVQTLLHIVLVLGKAVPELEGHVSVSHVGVNTERIISDQPTEGL
jgi:hypothetical protein